MGASWVVTAGEALCSKAPPASPAGAKLTVLPGLQREGGAGLIGPEEGLGLAQASSYCRGLARAAAPMCAAAMVGGRLGSTVQR